MARATVMLIMCLLVACDTRDAVVVHHVVTPGAGWTPDGSDPTLPRPPEDRLAHVAPDDALFHLVLDSSAIVEGHRLRVRKTTERPEPRPLAGPLDLDGDRSIEARVDRVLLGSISTRTIRVDTDCPVPAEIQELRVSCGDVRALVERGGPATLFLHRATQRFYFAPWRTAIRGEVPVPGLDAILRARETAGERLHRAPTPPIGARVDAEVARMTHTPREQYDAMRALASLGREAIPAMVRHMDDRTPLPSEWILVENHPGHWESHGHYGVATVTDALVVVSAISSNGPGCHRLWHGSEASEEDRSDCAASWTAFVARGLDEGAFGPAWR